MTIPNLLTVLRIILIPVFISQLYYQYFDWALITFVFAGISDATDGFIARTFNQSSELGKVLDPIADKLMMTAAFVVLSMPQLVPPSKDLPVPFWLTAGVIARDVLIIVVAGAIFMTTGFRRFRPSVWGKVSTFVQVISVGLILLATTFQQFTFYLPFIYYAVFILAALSGFHYIYFVNGLMKKEQLN